MKKLILLSFFILSTTISFAQSDVIGKLFPSITAETLTDKQVMIPEDSKGKYTIIGMAYSRDAESDLKTWLNPAYNKFIAKTGLLDMEIDVNLYFIPMFTGTNIPIAGKAKKSLQEDTDKEFYPHVLFYKGELKTYKKALEFDKKDTGYFFLLDRDGKIVWATSGRFTQKKMDALEDIIIDSE
ncbi:MAG: mitochondrial ATPase complex subunit ATP10 [Bacteroidota bacterium]|nr:mitochondrial ATPase complex subunit ATP10 [Bacteroidota bacterium]